MIIKMARGGRFINGIDWIDDFKDIYLSPDSSNCIHYTCAACHSDFNEVVKENNS